MKWVRPQDLEIGDRIVRLHNLNFWKVIELDSDGNVAIQDIAGNVTRFTKIEFIKAGFIRA